MEEYKNIEELFPYVEHSLRTICRPVLGGFQFCSDRLFSPLVIEGLDRIKEFKSKNPDSHLIYVSRHRSHLDYIETQLALGNAGIPARIQAGDNLFIGPLDPFWRELGAFMVVREGKGFYSKNWILNTFYSLIPLKKEYELYVDKKLATSLYESYLRHILKDDDDVKDLLVYPEYVKQADGGTKYGRSYSGGLSDFSPYLFLTFRKIISRLDKEFFFVPVNPSYERVIEDSFMIRIPALKEKFSRDLVYLQEFAYIGTRPLFPFFRRGEFVLKFGDVYKFEKSVRADALAERFRKEVGLLETIFSPQVVFYSLGGAKKIPFNSLEDRVLSNVFKLDPKVDTSRLKTGGRTKSFDAILEETLRLFDAPGRRYVRVKDNSLEVLDERIVSQYANHIAHLF